MFRRLGLFCSKTSIHFFMINNPFHVVVSYNAPFLLTLNSQTVLFSGLPTTIYKCKNGGKFKSCVNFGTPFIYEYFILLILVYKI